MKRCLYIILFFVFAMGTNVCAQSNREARVNYVIANLKLPRDKQKQMRRLLTDYLVEKKNNEAGYEALKDKYKTQIKTNKITDAAADKLLNAKWDAEQKEVALKKKYTPKFKAIITASQTWYCFDLLNDKKSKVRGEKSDDVDDAEE